MVNCSQLIGLGTIVLRNLLEAVHHFVYVSDVQFVPHCVNLLFSIGLD